MNDASKAAALELSNVDGVPCGEVVEVVVPAGDLQQQLQQKQQQQKHSLQDLEENKKWEDMKAQLKEPIQIKPSKVLVCIDRKQLYKMQAKKWTWRNQVVPIDEDHIIVPTVFVHPGLDEWR